MTANSGFSFTVLSVLCLGLAMMFVGGWYFRSSLVELKEQQQEFQSLLVELKTQQHTNSTATQRKSEEAK